MKKYSKRYNILKEKLKNVQLETLEGTVNLLKEHTNVKFDETCNLSLKLGIDLKKNSQPVRGSVNLPNGSGKKIKVLVFAQGEYVEKAKQAGADYVGGSDIIDKIKNGWLDFQSVIATPDMMKTIAPLGKILGPRGLMPNPKTGTVTFEIEQIISEMKKGREEFKMDKDGNIHLSVGKKSFSAKSLTENIMAAIKSIYNAKPQGAKGAYIKKAYVSFTMSPSLPLNINEIFQELKISNF
ncbi:MAG: 50S ribosomal protein L1 [Candidatus Omnitrophica bacterium]|nr:50S ribosomal protein L1 [Candidatus Omnitrophota bacterium]